MPVVFSYDDTQTVDPMPEALSEEEIAAGIVSRREQNMRQCGHPRDIFDQDHQQPKTIYFYCKIRGCPTCDHRRAVKQMLQIRHAAYTQPVYMLETDEAGWDELLKVEGYKKKDYKRIPHVDGTVTVFLSTPPASGVAVAELYEDAIERLDWDTICDTPYRERDGVTIKVSGNLGKEKAKPKLDTPITEERQLGFYRTVVNEDGVSTLQSLTRTEHETFITEVMATEVYQPMPTSYEEVMAQGKRVEDALIALAEDLGLTVTIQTRRKRFSYTIDQIQANYQRAYYQWAVELLKKGKIKAMPAHLHPLT
jgi:hypothetical protein